MGSLSCTKIMWIVTSPSRSQLEKTILEHHSYAIKKYQESERKLDEDVRIASLQE